MRLVVLIIGTALAVLFMVQEKRGSEAAYLFSDLDELQYAVSFDAGFCTLPSITDMHGVMKGLFV